MCHVCITITVAIIISSIILYPRKNEGGKN